MKKTSGIIALSVALAALLSSCADKEKSGDIVTRKVAKTVKKATQKVGDYSQSRVVDWHGAAYTVAVERKADTSLPLIDDGAGNKYYDNRISVRITDKTGRDVLSRVFTKSDFSAYVDASYAKQNALLGVVFDKVDGDYLYFAASIGSPDKMSDEFVPLLVKVAYGDCKVSISKDTMLDTDNAQGADAELLQAESEGM